MKKTRTEKQWGICLTAVAVTTLILCISAVSDWVLPDALRISLGVIEILAIPLMVFFTIRLMKESKNPDTSSTDGDELPADEQDGLNE